MTHWAANLIGIPWERCAQGPDAYDCWSFFRFVQKEQYGIDVPYIQAPADVLSQAKLFDAHSARANWEQVAQPQDGDAVLMARGRYPVHIGVWVTADSTSGVLHCMQEAGVVFMLLSGLRAAGWGGVSYYRYKLDAAGT